MKKYGFSSLQKNLQIYDFFRYQPNTYTLLSLLPPILSKYTSINQNITNKNIFYFHTSYQSL